MMEGRGISNPCDCVGCINWGGRFICDTLYFAYFDMCRNATVDISNSILGPQTNLKVQTLGRGYGRKLLRDDSIYGSLRIKIITSYLYQHNS